MMPPSRQKKELTACFARHRAQHASDDVGIVFIDACHLVWDDAREYVWGKSHAQVTIPMTNFRLRQTYYGAIEHATGEVTVYPAEAGTGAATVAFVESRREK